jgi:hypothetical protein
MADEDFAAARGIWRGCRVIGAVDAQAPNVGIEREARQAASFNGASKELVIQIKGRRVVCGAERIFRRYAARFYEF